MGLFDNGIRLGTGMAIGIGAIILAPAVVPVVAAAARPLVKAALKSGMIFIERSKEVLAETKEMLEDLAAEAQAELAKETQPTAPSVPSEQGTG